MIRLFKPGRIIEIGAGNSTLIASGAVQANKKEDPARDCVHVCVEPHERPWLEELDITTIRQRVEELGVDLFSSLEENDILFIDSSHIIRPQGDVVFEILEILPTLKPGVFVHFHDIFTPKDYLNEWLIDEVMFWNEQYILEAFLSFNNRFRVKFAQCQRRGNLFILLQ